MWHEFTSQIQDLTHGVDLLATTAAGLIGGAVLSLLAFWVASGV